MTKDVALCNALGRALCDHGDEKRSVGHVRMLRELAGVRQQASVTGYTLAPHAADELYAKIPILNGQIPGPAAGPWAGASFNFTMNVPADYPFKPPAVRFITPNHHPLICPSSGTFDMPQLREEWSAVTTLGKVLSLLSDFIAVEEFDPSVLNPQAAQDYLDAGLDRSSMNMRGRIGVPVDGYSVPVKLMW